MSTRACYRFIVRRKCLRDPTLVTANKHFDGIPMAASAYGSCQPCL